MDAGVHLPQFPVRDADRPDATRALSVVAAARDLGFAAVAANDHFAFRRPWLDGLTLLAAASEHAGGMELATTIALPALRGPAALAAGLATLDALAPGRVVAGVGAGSSSTDYALARVPFAQRWQRFDESVTALRALLRGEPVPQEWGGRLPEGQVAAAAVATGPIPLWLASWGSAAGLRRVARLGDGWLASAYNTTPELFAEGQSRLADLRSDQDRPPLPCALATMWAFVSADRGRASEILADLAGTLGRDVDDLRDRVCVGSAEQCVDLLGRYAAAGCERVYLWPLADEVDQLELLAHDVLPLVPPTIIAG